MPTLTVKISKTLRSRMEAAAKRRQITQSELVRQAIETSLRESAGVPGTSLYDRMSDLIGVGEEGPPDLATNKQYLNDLGLDGPAVRDRIGPRRKRVARGRHRAR